MMFEETFSIRIPYNRECTTDLSRVMGKNFNKKTREYEFPAIEIFTLAEVVSEHLPGVAKQLLNGPRFEKERTIAKDAESLIYLSRAKRVRFEPPVPDGLSLRPHQKAGVYYSTINNRDNVLIADQMGTGKTPMTVAIANCLGIRKALFISPNSAKINWQREILRWSTITDNVGVLSATSTLRDMKRYDYCTINYDILKKFQSELFSIDWNMVVGDEAHMMKNPKAQRTAVAMELCDRADYRALLTGSPIVNRPHEVWNLIHTLNPIFWRNWKDFVHTYCDAFTNPYTGEFNYKGASNLPELQDKLRMTLMLRRLKKDVLKDLPPKTRQIIEIPATQKFNTLLMAQEKYVGKIKSAYDVLDQYDEKLSPEENERVFRDKIKKCKKMDSSEFEEMQRLRHMTALAKAPEIGEFAKDILESKPKIGIYAHHRDVLDYYIKLFGKQAVSIIGGDSPTKRQKAIDDFQTKDRIRVFIGSIYAAGTAITLTASDVCIMAEIDCVPGINGQVEDRFHRIGTINPVNIYYMMLEGSLDWYIANMVITKMEIIEKALDTKQSRIHLRKRLFH